MCLHLRIPVIGLGPLYSSVTSSRLDSICTDPLSKQGPSHTFGIWDLEKSFGGHHSIPHYYMMSMVANPLTGITAGNLFHAVALQGKHIVIMIIVPILQKKKPSLRALLRLASPCPGHCPPHHTASQPVELLVVVDGMSYEFINVNVTSQKIQFGPISGITSTCKTLNTHVSTPLSLPISGQPWGERRGRKLSY